MNKRVAFGVVLLVALLVVALIWRMRSRSETERAADHGSGATTVGSAGGALRPDDPQRAALGVPAWLAQIGVPARRVAGHVVYAGKPVAGATVRLALQLGELLQSVGERKTGADGAFDFGPQPAATFTVSAEAADRTPAMKSIALADPKVRSDRITLELTDCRSRLYGSVLDASGGAIAKAKLLAAGHAGAESDGAGQYSLCVAQNYANVKVAADGYGSIQVNVHLFGNLRYDFVLVPEAVLVGQVITRDKRPVGGARVLAYFDPSEGPHHLANGWGISDDDGRFRIAGLSPGRYRLVAMTDGLASSVPVDAIAQPGTASKDTILIVDAIARVSGHVMMAGKPVGGAHVTFPVPSRISVSEAFSLEDGSFVVTNVAFGKVPVGAAPYEVKEPKLLEIKTPKLDDVTIEVAAMGVITGRVLRHGKPVAGAEVACAQRPGPPVLSDESGTYVLDALPAGSIRFFGWDVNGRAFGLEKTVTLAAAETKTVDIELDRAGVAKGIVVDESKKPVPGVYVRMISDDGKGDLGESMTDANGAFECSTMAGGDYLPNVYPSPMAGKAFEPATGDAFPAIKVPIDDAVTGVTLAIKHELFSIRGNVVDDKGAPVADVHIEAIGRGQGGMDLPSIMSTVAGTFEIRNLARGTYNLHAHSADGGEGDASDIVAGAENVAIKMLRPGSLEGTLVGFSTTPQIQLMTLTADLQIGANAIVEGNRFYQIGLRPGRYALEAKAGLESDGASVEIKSGETTKVTLTSRGTGKVEGHITELGTKAPLPGFRCDAILTMNGQMGGPPGDPSQISHSDDKGHFAMASPLGKVRVFCFAEGDPGISVAGIDLEVTGQATAIAEVRAVRSTFGATPGDAGFQIRPMQLPLIVNTVRPGSAAATQGVRVGDLVTTIDGASLQGVLPMGAMILIQNHRPGTIVTVGLDRGGTPLSVKLPVVAAPP
jgi:hypothetical protein